MERHIALMCRYQRQWAEVEALVCNRSWRSEASVREGTQVMAVGEWGRFQSAPVSPMFPWYMRRLDADVVIVHVPNPTAEVGYLLGRPRGKLLVRYHSDVVRQAAAMRVYRPVLMHFLRQAAIIAPTSAPYMETSPVLQEVQDRCRVAPLGILTEDFAYPEEERLRAVRERYGERYVLFAGCHRYYKGLPNLVRAAAQVDAPVVIAGDGPERATCMALAKQLGVQVHFPGVLSQEDLVAYLHGCTVFAFPSVARSEAFGIAIMEAHACGKPVVATRLGTGVEFINEDGKTGYNVPPGDPQALATALNRLLADQQQCAAMGTYARERVTREFHAEQAARREFALCEEVMECSNSRT